MTYRGLPADYDAWKTRSDRDDDWWNEPEPETEECMAEPTDIAALVERLQERAINFPSPAHSHVMDEAANALEACQAEIERLRKYSGIEDTKTALKQIIDAAKVEARVAALEEAAQVVDEHASVEGIAQKIAAAIRALKDINERNPT